MILPSRNPLSGSSVLIASVWYAKYLFSDFTFFACTFRTAISIVRSVRFTSRIFQKSEDLSLREFISNMGLKWKWRPLTTILWCYFEKHPFARENLLSGYRENERQARSQAFSGQDEERPWKRGWPYFAARVTLRNLVTLVFYEAWNNCMSHQNVVTFLTLFSNDMPKANII